MIDEDAISERFAAICGKLNEAQVRAWAAGEARAAGWGGIEAVHRATGLSHGRIGRGLSELADGSVLAEGRVRRGGAGRPPVSVTQPGVVLALETHVAPHTAGDPESLALWTPKSTRELAADLGEDGFRVSHRTVGKLLAAQGYSLQANRRKREGDSHPDRDGQFRYLNALAEDFVTCGEPLFSIDAKSKVLVGDHYNKGRTWQKQGKPVEVETYDFIGPAGRVTPYGVYDVASNTGFVNVGISADTAKFAVESLRRYWNQHGHKRFPNATRLMLTADGGGSNASRSRLFKSELQQFANEIELPITVCHLPPATSKWNKIEHRMWSFVSINWRGKPLASYEIILDLIASTTTSTGLTIASKLDQTHYEKGIKITDKQMRLLNLVRHDWHGNWNYTITPQTTH